MVALRSQGNWRWEGSLGTPLGLVHWKRASSPVEAGTAGLRNPIHSVISSAAPLIRGKSEARLKEYVKVSNG